MEYTQLGKSGLKISKIVLGAMSYGDPNFEGWILPEEQALPLLKHAYDVGINTWDTADIYSNGESERIIGRALKKYSIPRERVVIMTKCFCGLLPTLIGLTPAEMMMKGMSNDGEMVNQVGLSRKHIFDAVDASVERLGTYIDVLQIHRLDRDTPREEIMKALNDVVVSGKVRYIGSSSMHAWEFQALNNIAEKHGWVKFISMQNYYNLLYREEEREMIPYCRDAGIGLIPWSPLAKGALTRPFNSRNTQREQKDQFVTMMVRAGATEADEMVIGKVEEMAKKKGVSMAVVATSWCLMKGVMPILGLGSKERIDEAVESVKSVKKRLLTEEDIKELEECYVPKSVAPLW